MKSLTIAKGIIKAIGFFLTIAVLLVILYKVQSLILYLLAAGVLALLGRPMVNFFVTRLKVSKTLAALITVFFIFLLLVGLVILFVPMLTEQGKNLALVDYHNIQLELDKLYAKFSEYLGTSKDTIKDLMADSEIEQNVSKEFATAAVPTLFDALLKLSTELSVGLFSIIFMTFFMLKDKSSFQQFILAMMPEKHLERTLNSIDKIKNLLSRYFLGLLVQIAILFVIYSATLLLVGTENALIVAFFCALFNILPYIGPLIGAALMIVLTITSHINMDFSQDILLLVGYVLIGVTIGQLLDNFVSQPFIYSNSVKSHPMEIFVIIIAIGLIFGIPGMIIAVPGYAVIKVIVKEFFRYNRFVRFWTKGI
ncbi:AI-2E family transporter [Aggregatimonas sangjinii]|uniref:AI-2E family transporter n=1 Tax=Aggregatimonas sangjinii TaxID=2583587 RepID=A0A5B7SQ25_9FLAO|nr:AI-2E family transporter [Aggregatimonas sangjinii]QCW99498.1 AI-2E family transporter [Aggregatimonas sangjinii]